MIIPRSQYLHVNNRSTCRKHRLSCFAKLKKFQKSKNNFDRAHPTHPTHRSSHWHGQNTQIVITNNVQQCIYRQNTHGILGLLQNINTGLGLFWDDFPKKSKWDLDPPTHFHINLGFFEKKFVAKPLNSISTDLDVTCPDERRLSLEVLRVDDVIFARVENEFRQMNLAFVDGIE